MSQSDTDGVDREETRKERIKVIPPLDLGPIPKAELILVILGLKPAMAIQLSSWNISADTFENALQSAELSFINMERSGANWADYAIARTRETAGMLRHVMTNTYHADDTYHVEFGKLMGFPETAIRAFVGKEVVLDGEIPEDPSIVIGGFTLSRGHWKEEREIQREWTRAIEQYAPEVYLELKKH